MSCSNARALLSEKELSDLTVVVGVINFWNRLAGTFRTLPGSADRAYGLEASGLEASSHALPASA